jgi:hypothetical protein
MLDCRAEGRSRHLAERDADSFIQSDSPSPIKLKEAGVACNLRAASIRYP